MIATAFVTPDEAAHLVDLRQSVRRVHKSLPVHSPARQASSDLSTRLAQLHRRGVPLHVLAGIVGLSHQAIRVRVRVSEEESEDSRSDPSAVTEAPTLSIPTDDLVLVADAGVHRRLHIYDPPHVAGQAFLSLAGDIPLLKDRAGVVAWLESETDTEPPSDAPGTSTRLRTPPAVYLPRDMLDSTLVPLTTEEAEEEAD